MKLPEKCGHINKTYNKKSLKLSTKNFVTRMWNFSMLKASYKEIENELFQL